VHFPWCIKKCPYCDFASLKIDPATLPHARYADAVLAELNRRRSTLGGRELVSVFFGGGTPSLWEPGELGRVLAAIVAAFDHVSPDLEITVECNPSSLDRDRAAEFVAQGVSRLSIGVQALDDEHLQYLGRAHDGLLAIQAVEGALTKAPRVSADLMFGMPGQTEGALERAIKRLLDLGIEHVSAYSLTIEPGTQFGELHRVGKLRVAAEDDVAGMFCAAEGAFQERGLDHYEVSNYAKKGQEARHNQHYWRGGSYLGLGAAAVGCLDDGPGAALRWRNEPDPENYMSRSGTDQLETFEEHLGPQEIVREALMLGLRTREGMNLSATASRAGVDPFGGRQTAIARRIGRGDVVHDGPWLRVPTARWLHLDGIVADLF